MSQNSLVAPSRVRHVAVADTLWRGFVEVVAGRDAPPRFPSARARRVATALGALGAAVVVAAVVSIVLSLDPAYQRVGRGLTTKFLPPGASPLHALSLGVQVVNVNVKSAFVSPVSNWLLVAAIVALVGVGPLLLALRLPIVGWRVSYVAAVFVPIIAFISFGPPRNVVFVPQELAASLLVFCVAGLRHSRVALWWMWVLMILPIWLWLGPGLVKRLAAVGALMLVTIALDATGASQRARRALAAQFERTELEETRRSVLEERTRIAREMHDVVAHHMSLIAVQAETAPYRLRDLPTDVLSEFDSLSGRAREALADMRRLLGVLRNEGPAERSPQPQLEDVPDLVAANRRAGVNVDLTMPEGRARVSPGIGLCAYRIVQEALSNANRHALGSNVSVRVEESQDALHLLVTNGPGTAMPAPTGSARPGHGLAGMRERVAILGGHLIAEPGLDGGFVVSADLPMERELVLSSS